MVTAKAVVRLLMLTWLGHVDLLLAGQSFWTNLPPRL